MKFSFCGHNILINCLELFGVRKRNKALNHIEVLHFLLYDEMIELEEEEFLLYKSGSRSIMITPYTV